MYFTGFLKFKNAAIDKLQGNSSIYTILHIHCLFYLNTIIILHNAVEHS